MTDDELLALARRAQEKAPGTWEADEIDPNDPDWAAFDLFADGDKIGHTVGTAPSRVFGREIAAYIAAANPAAIIALIERHLAEVERLTRERDEALTDQAIANNLARSELQKREAAEAALIAAQKRVGVLQNVAGETLAALDKLDPLQAVLPVQQANLRAALAGGTASR